MTTPNLDPAAVRAQLDRILASDGFVNAGRMRRFLHFTVDAKLTGQEDGIKEYLLGREVFDRDDRYDPRLDPIVRVEARRLRNLLDEYYSGPGLADPLRITLPKGRYVPAIEPAVNSQPAGWLHPKRLIWWTAATIVVALAIIAIDLSSRTAAMIAVIPARWVWADTAGLSPLDERLAEVIAAEIANRNAARVVAWPSVAGYRGASQDTRAIAKGLGASKLLMVAVRGGEAARVTVYMIDAASNQKLWVGDYQQSGLASLQQQHEIAKTVAQDFATRTKSSRR